MSGIYDGEGGVISKEKNFHIPLPRESRHGSVVPGTMNRSSCLGQLMPVGRSHEQNFMTELKEKQHPATPGVERLGVADEITILLPFLLELAWSLAIPVRVC